MSTLVGYLLVRLLVMVSGDFSQTTFSGTCYTHCKCLHTSAEFPAFYPLALSHPRTSALLSRLLGGTRTPGFITSQCYLKWINVVGGLKSKREAAAERGFLRQHGSLVSFLLLFTRATLC